ncbi:MAG TPA: hypothetical protein VGZ26_08010, partial [Pirellulales bacterium]|nr:hypothetical protein [Pirellulales bacterium]
QRWAWPAAAIAAALVIALFDTERKPPERQVVQTRAPQGETFIGARENSEAPAEDAKLRDEFASKLAVEESKKPEPILAKRQDAPGGERPMSPGKAKAAVPAAAAASPVAAKPSIQLTTELDDDTVTVICDVTPAFARDRGFEKLLSQQKIAYRRGDQRDVKQAGPADRAQTENLSRKQPDEGPYEVDATPEQVDQIITLLRQDVSNVGRIAKDQTASQSYAKEQLKVDENAAPPAQNQAQSRANQRARAQFQFRVVDSLPPQKARN